MVVVKYNSNISRVSNGKQTGEMQFIFTYNLDLDDLIKMYIDLTSKQTPIIYSSHKVTSEVEKGIRLDSS